MMARCLSGPRAQNSSQKRSHVFFHVNAVMQTQRKGCYIADFNVFNECSIQISIVVCTLLTKIKKNSNNIRKKMKQWKLLNISHFKAGTQLFVCEHIMGCPVHVTSFVPPVPSPSVVRRVGFFLCGSEPNQNAW